MNQQIRNEAITLNIPLMDFTKTSTLIYSDSSYIGLCNITLGYELPTNFLQKLKIANAKIYISEDNLWTGTRSRYESRNDYWR